MASVAKQRLNGFILGIVFSVLLLGAFFGGAIADRLFVISPLDEYIPRDMPGVGISRVEQRVLDEQSFVVDIAASASESVVTVSIEQQRQRITPFFDPFGFFPRFEEQEPETIERDIGTGFVVDQEQGFVVTNKHVVSRDNASYTVITKNDEEFEVERIYRDPVNDLAILQISGDVPPALELGDSDELRVGQFAMAIGTALGEFRHTVTTGVVSGLGRGITAGDGWGGFAEELDNVIQTDVAINPGNSGGPLLNSLGQVVGVNTAVARAENIGFAIPIDVVKESLDNFNATGQFERPFLGVRYRMIPQETALMNDVPAGAYIVEVVADSAAADAGIQEGDIVTEINGVNLADTEGGLAEVINSLRAGETATLTLFRDGEMQEVQVQLRTSDEVSG